MLAPIMALAGLSRRSLENPNVPLTTEAFERFFGWGGTTDAGVRMGPEQALDYAPVWQAVSMISGDIAKLPLLLYRRERDEEGRETRERDESHPAAWVVSEDANDETHAFHFWRTMMVHVLIWGRAYALIQRNSAGRPWEVYNLLPDRTHAERMTRAGLMAGGIDPTAADLLDGQLVYVSEIDGRLRVFYPQDILHLRTISLDGVEGCELVQHARNSWGLGLAQQKFAAKFFAHGGRVGGILELPAAMPKPARDKMEEGFRKSYEGAENPFKTVILREGAKFHAAQVTPEASQLVEATEGQVRQVARWFNLSPSKLGLSDSVSYNSKSEDNQSYLDTTLSPWLKQIVAECSMKLLTIRERAGRFFEHDVSALLRMDALKRYQVYQIALNGRIMSRNEVRARENLNPVEGGDVFDAAPGSPVPATEQGPPAEDEPASAPEPAESAEPTETPPPAEPKRSARAIMLLRELAGSARHKAKRPEVYLQWVDDMLPSPLGEKLRANGLGPLADQLRGAADYPPEKLSAAVESILASWEC